MKTFILICIASLVIFFNHSKAQWEELGIKNGFELNGGVYTGIAASKSNLVVLDYGDYGNFLGIYFN